MTNELTSKFASRLRQAWALRIAVAAVLFGGCVVLSSCSGSAKSQHCVKDCAAEGENTDAGADSAVGDWRGNWVLSDESDSGPLAVQVEALGNDAYRATFLDAFDTQGEPIGVLEGKRSGGVVSFGGRAKYNGMEFEVEALIRGGKLTGTFEGLDASGTFDLDHILRASAAVGAEPEQGVRL
ncbi:MAG: hypothetical protein JW720_11285 [Sedimentisphaerales bacterium]|nr:hypothetical protein [Sedimentisphaerales bacterium]